MAPKQRRPEAAALPTPRAARCGRGSVDPGCAAMAAEIGGGLPHEGHGEPGHGGAVAGKGAAPFIPAERLPGYAQALQLLWDKMVLRLQCSAG
eukprot:Skav204953  [mRNA]  locus=scaffold3104:190301:191433:+ [translate_table: standard]